MLVTKASWSRHHNEPVEVGRGRPRRHLRRWPLRGTTGCQRLSTAGACAYVALDILEPSSQDQVLAGGPSEKNPAPQQRSAALKGLTLTDIIIPKPPRGTSNGKVKALWESRRGTKSSGRATGQRSALSSRGEGSSTTLSDRSPTTLGCSQRPLPHRHRHP
jgi:hypothetical protein